MSQNIEDLIEEKKKQVETILDGQEFYEDPQKVFTEFTNSLPDSKLAWRLAFVSCFLLSNLAECSLRNQIV